jgi:hypothetical protein
MERIALTIFLVGCIGCSNERDHDSKPIDLGVTYFLVAETTPDHSDSFLLPLRNPADIETARTLITTGESKIVLAEISKTTGDKIVFNKDLANNRMWSWYVSDFLGFVDTTIEIYDGWPEYVEENYTEWVNTTKGENGNGRIGFWNYRVVREVALDEIK